MQQACGEASNVLNRTNITTQRTASTTLPPFFPSDALKPQQHSTLSPPLNTGEEVLPPKAPINTSVGRQGRHQRASPHPHNYTMHSTPYTSNPFSPPEALKP